ncbi:MAG: PRC and DUF2382 domain-containing protein [Actinobacteria bacterium]|nr:PRC and DUF2382 domain-containing protein [Actinomycetota bacterium]
MTDTTTATWNDWYGADVVDSSGDKIGTLETVYTDLATGQPEWMAVRTGLFGMKNTFVPLQGVDANGDALQVPYTKAQVKDAPNIDPEGDTLTPEEEERLYRHYGREADWSTGWDAHEGHEGHEHHEHTTGHDTSGPTTDDAMTRSEEEIQVGTADREVGRARLRKYVVTENVTTTVPVRKEKVRIEREPITDANIDRALDGPAISEEEHEIVLHEEEPVVGKTVTPKERVRLDKDVDIEQEQVSEDVRKEQIEVEGADADLGTRRGR